MSEEEAWLPGDLLQPERPSPRAIVNDAIRQFDPIAIFALFSGGDGSLAATHWAMNNVSGCQVGHIVTGIGMPAVEEYVRETCAREGWKLTVIRAKEDCGQDYDEIVSEHGFPGPAAHSLMYRRLKERAIEKLVRDIKNDPRRSQRSRSDRVMLLTGICQDDSVRRSGYGGAEVTRKGAQVWVNAMYWMGFSWTHDYIERHAIPRNPMSIKYGMSCECLCGAFAAKGELDMVRRACPALAERIEALQHRVSNRHPWGWEDRPPPKVIADLSDGDPSLFQPMCRNCLKVDRL